MKLSDYIVDFLIQHGITEGFGYPGGSVTNFLDSVNRRSGEIECHVVYHEQAAAFAASGYASVTGKPGLCYATGGPGCTNLLTGIGHAYYDSIPVIAITGNVNTYEARGNLPIRQRGFQENDNVSAMKSLTKYSTYIKKPESIRYELEKAYYIATTGRKGPVHIDLPMDIQRAQINPEELRGYEQEAEASDSCDKDVFRDKISRLMKEAKHPCLVLGNGIKTSGARREAREMIDHLKIPYVTSMIAFDVLSDSKYNYGFVGAYGSRTANFVMAKSDLVVAVGSRMDIRQVGAVRENFAPGAKIVRIDVDEGELTYKVHKDELSVFMDLRDALDILNSLENMPDYSDWVSKCDSIKEKLAGIDDRLPNRFMTSISDYIPANAIISTDVGQNQVWVSQSFRLKKGQEALFSGGMGSMGHALPAMIGAYYGDRTRPVVCVSGDGGMQMNIQELHFITRENIPAKIIIFNHHALGMIRHFQEMYFDRDYYQATVDSGYTTPDFVKIAEAYGIRGLALHGLDDVEKCKELLSDDKACLIEIHLMEDTYVIPKLKYGNPNQDQDPLLGRELYEVLMEM